MANQLIVRTMVRLQNNSHGAHGIKPVVEQKAKLFQCLLLQQVGFVQDADNFLVLYAPDYLDFLLQLTF